MFLPTTSFTYYVIQAGLLLFLVRPFVSLAAPNAKIPLMVAGLGPALHAVLLVVTNYAFAVVGPTVPLLGHAAAALLLWVGLALAVAAMVGAAEAGGGGLVQRFPGPFALIGIGLFFGLVNIAGYFAPFLPFPAVIEVTAGVVCVVAGLLGLMDGAWPVRGALPPRMEQFRVAQPGSLFFPGFIGFFATSFLILGLVSRTDGPPGWQISRTADLACLDVLLIGWGIFMKRHIPFFWMLERRLGGIVWIFIRQTRVISRSGGSWTVWASNIGTDSGEILTQSTGGSNQEAEQLSMMIAQMCPGATQGFNADLKSRFSKDPNSLRRA